MNLLMTMKERQSEIISKDVELEFLKSAEHHHILHHPRGRLASPSDFRFEVVSLFTAGNDYANEWVMLGSNDREVRGVPATGRSFRVRGASIGRPDASGRIVENRDYYNLAELLTQPGMLPTAPSQPA